MGAPSWCGRELYHVVHVVGSSNIHNNIDDKFGW